MAELIGVVASVVGIAGVGIKLSKTLYVAAEKQVHASHNINRIATNVTLFSSMLKQFAVVLQDAKSLYSPEALDTTKQIVDECSSVFREITGLVVLANGQDDGRGTANEKKPRMKITHKIRWYFEQPRVEVLLQQLEYLKTTLSVLLQTLHLAAVLAQTKEKTEMSEKETQKIIEERIHIETLVMARQLTVVILQQFAAQAEENGQYAPVDNSALLGPGTEEPAPGSNMQKLLTLEPANQSMSLVKIGGGGNLDFLDRAPAQPMEAFFPGSLPQTNSPIVDQLLGRMTRVNEVEVYMNEMKDDMPSSKSQMLHRSTTLPSEKSNHGLESELSVSDSSNFIAQSRATTGADSSLPPPPKSMNGLGIGNMRATSPIPPPPMGPAPPKSPMKAPASNITPPPSAGGERNILTTPIPSAPTSIPGGTMVPYRSPNAVEIPRSPTNAPGGIASPRTPFSVDWSQPRSHRAASWSRNSSPGPATPTSDDEEEDRTHHIDLGIPWRIRIGTSKYFDFLDGHLVGPRTPYLPSEPMSWVYSHDNAQTEISSSWVCEEAIAERQYAYSEARGDDFGGAAPVEQGSQEIKWTIMCPLKFNEIEGLVERTVDIYRQKNATAVEQQPRPRAVPQQQAPQFAPTSRPPQFQTPSQQYPQQPAAGYGPTPPHLQPNRSVSFSAAAPPRAARPEWERSQTGNERNVHWAPSPALSSAQPSYYSVSPGATPAQQYPASATAPRSYRDADWSAPDSGWNNRGEPPRYDAERDRAYRTADRDLERRGKAKDGKKASSEYSSKSRKKAKAGSMAGTLASIGGLAALLEGLDVV